MSRYAFDLSKSWLESRDYLDGTALVVRLGMYLLIQKFWEVDCGILVVVNEVC